MLDHGASEEGPAPREKALVLPAAADLIGDGGTGSPGSAGAAGALPSLATDDWRDRGESCR